MAVKSIQEGELHLRDNIFERDMDKIVATLIKAGYDAIGQLIAYAETGKTYYITRTDGARARIQKYSVKQVREYLEKMDSRVIDGL